MKAEALVLSLGGIGWMVNSYLLFPTTPKFALLVCLPVAVLCFYFGRKA
jgi:hypothetical protein